MNVSTAPYPNPRYSSRQLSPIGKSTPVAAPNIESVKVRLQQIDAGRQATLKYYKDKSDVAQIQKSLLSIMVQDVRQWLTVDNTNGNWPNDSSADNFGRKILRDPKKREG
jgi:hypothetical protein